MNFQNEEHQYKSICRPLDEVKNSGKGFKFILTNKINSKLLL